MTAANKRGYTTSVMGIPPEAYEELVRQEVRREADWQIDRVVMLMIVAMTLAGLLVGAAVMFLVLLGTGHLT